MTPTPRLPTAYNLIRLETVDSTNAEARRLAVQGEDAAPDGTLIWALEQTQGKGRRGRTAPIKELGVHPDDGKPVAVYDGRYGPYVKHGKTNATIPKDQDPQSVTLEQAVELIAARVAKQAASKGGAKKGTAAKKKAPAKKKAARKAETAESAD